MYISSKDQFLVKCLLLQEPITQWEEMPTRMEKIFLLGFNAVKKHFYMDNGLPSTNSQQEGIEMRKQMTELPRPGGSIYING